MPASNLTIRRSRYQHVALQAKRHTKDDSKGIGEYRVRYIGLGKVDIRPIDPLQVGLPHHQAREVVSLKRTAHLDQEIQHVSSRITGVLVGLCALSCQHALKSLLKRFFSKDVEKLVQEWQYDEAALTLPDILFRLGFEQRIAIKEFQCLGLDLLTGVLEWFPSVKIASSLS